MTVIQMSRSELSRVDTLQRLARGELALDDVTQLLRITDRHLRRLRARLAAEGAAGLASKKRGRPSNRRRSEAVRQQVLELVRAHYADFGPTLAAEYLAERHGVQLSHETLRQWMIEAGMWTSRKARRPQIHQPRYRRDCRGELIQIDGSLHHWFEDRGPPTTLLVFIDDATSELMHLEMVESENTFAYMEATRAYIERHGKPLAFYSDKHSVFRNNTASAKGDGMTHFGRALDTLGIEIICAHSPQAKGRVERANGTLQNRLVKALRLAGISTLADANAFLPDYMAAHNARFAKPAFSPQDRHRPLGPDERLAETMVWREERSVTAALTLHYNKALFILEPNAISRSCIRKRVMVCEYPDGRVEIRYGEHVLPYRIFDKIRQVNQAAVVDSKQLGAALAMAQALQAQLKPRKRNNNEPCRRSQAAHLFPPPADGAPKFDRRRLGLNALKKKPGVAVPAE